VIYPSYKNISAFFKIEEINYIDSFEGARFVNRREKNEKN